MSLPGPACDEWVRFMGWVRDYLIEHFGISIEEAEARITDMFDQPPFDLMDPIDLAMHEDDEYWAKSMMYNEPYWWMAGQVLTLRPWPPEPRVADGPDTP